MRIPTLIALVAGCGIAIGIGWLLLGSRILLVVDRLFPGLPSPQPINDRLIDADNFVVNDRKWPLPRSGPPQLKIILDSRNRLVLLADGRAFTFGPVQKMWSDKVEPQYLFVPETGDAVSFTRDSSRLSWQTPFAFSVMGIYLPKFHRYAYFRLRWTKNSGAAFEIMWRDQEDYYPKSGWQEDYNIRLTNVRIRVSPIEEAAARYLAGAKGWTGAEYRLQMQPVEIQQAGPEEEVTAIYLKDETASHPGAGKSVVLRVNKLSKKVVSEAAFQ